MRQRAFLCFKGEDQLKMPKVWFLPQIGMNRLQQTIEAIRLDTNRNRRNAMELLTPREVGAKFNVSPKTVTRWAKEGKVRSLLTPGGQHRIYADSVDQYLSDNLLTASQVGQIFRVDPKTVVRWAKEGKLDGVLTPGGQHRFFAEEVQQLIEG